MRKRLSRNRVVRCRPPGHQTPRPQSQGISIGCMARPNPNHRKHRQSFYSHHAHWQPFGTTQKGKRSQHFIPDLILLNGNHDKHSSPQYAIETHYQAHFGPHNCTSRASHILTNHSRSFHSCLLLRGQSHPFPTGTPWIGWNPVQSAQTSVHARTPARGKQNWHQRPENIASRTIHTRNEHRRTPQPLERSQRRYESSRPQTTACAVS